MFVVVVVLQEEVAKIGNSHIRRLMAGEKEILQSHIS
jgi:hypothetical protein